MIDIKFLVLNSNSWNDFTVRKWMIKSKKNHLC